MRVDHFLFIFAPNAGTNLLGTAIADELGLIVEDKSDYSSVELVSVTETIADIRELLNHNVILAEGDLGREIQLGAYCSVSLVIF